MWYMAERRAAHDAAPVHVITSPHRETLGEEDKLAPDAGRGRST